MQIAIGSAFRACARTIVPRYMHQVSRLVHAAPQHTFRLISVEGDSNDRDRTRNALAREALELRIPLDLRTCNHGGPVFGSVESSERFTALSKVGNTIFGGVSERDDVLVYVESDLLWTPETILRLIERAASSVIMASFSPLVFAGDLFYDVWGFRGLDGGRFSPFPPFHSSIEEWRTRLVCDWPMVQVSSVGSCLVMPAVLARSVRITENDCLVGWCKNAASLGAHIFVDTSLRVGHPL